MSEGNENISPEVQERVHNALSAAIAPNGEAIVTRWIVVAEVYAEDGKSCMYLAAPDMASWEIVGMSEISSELARTQFGANVINSMYEDADFEDDDDE